MFQKFLKFSKKFETFSKNFLQIIQKIFFTNYRKIILKGGGGLQNCSENVPKNFRKFCKKFLIFVKFCKNFRQIIQKISNNFHKFSNNIPKIVWIFWIICWKNLGKAWFVGEAWLVGKRECLIAGWYGGLTGEGRLIGGGEALIGRGGPDSQGGGAWLVVGRWTGGGHLIGGGRPDSQGDGLMPGGGDVEWWGRLIGGGEAWLVGGRPDSQGVLDWWGDVGWWGRGLIGGGRPDSQGGGGLVGGGGRLMVGGTPDWVGEHLIGDGKALIGGGKVWLVGEGLIGGESLIGGEDLIDGRKAWFVGGMPHWWGKAWLVGACPLHQTFCSVVGSHSCSPWREIPHPCSYTAGSHWSPEKTPQILYYLGFPVFWYLPLPPWWSDRGVCFRLCHVPVANLFCKRFISRGRAKSGVFTI